MNKNLKSLLVASTIGLFCVAQTGFATGPGPRIGSPPPLSVESGPASAPATVPAPATAPAPDSTLTPPAYKTPGKTTLPPRGVSKPG